LNPLHNLTQNGFVVNALRDKALQHLRKLCNDSSVDFREGQWEAIDSIVNHFKRLLLVRRTGWGKSAVYFIASKLMRENGFGPALLVSPLLALMRNQIDAATQAGISAYTVNSSNTEQWNSIREKLGQNKIDILLISPERLANEEFLNEYLLPVINSIGFFIIDEAHCISDWGHDFRPDYKRIVRILNLLPDNVPVLSTTATANDRVVKDIKTQLGYKLEVSRGSLTRTSLKLQNVCLPDPAARMAWLSDHLEKIQGSGIIYTLTVRDSQRLAEWLNSRGISAVAYNAELPNEQRVQIEQDLLSNKIKAVVGTTALGMGYDKPDLGFVIHYQRPGSVVHYYQQVGRAGRAVESAYGILFRGKEDDDIVNYFIEQAFPPQKYVDQILDALSSSDGLSTSQLQETVNIPRGRIEHTLKYLSTEEPCPIRKQDRKWFRTPVSYKLDTERVREITEIRYQEQKVMQEYMQTEGCLMVFLANELNDAYPKPCGKCANCVGESHFPMGYSEDTAIAAIEFLKRSFIEIPPRKKWLKDAFPTYGFSGNIGDLTAETGRCLSSWGDPAWGQKVKLGKQEQGHFEESLVEATVDLVKNRWKPQPFPKWVTCIPSNRNSSLVPDFTRRVAKRLGLHYSNCVTKIREHEHQKLMQNSFYQAKNLDGVFDVNREKVYNSPVLLIDDMVDSRWTFTVVTALLRQAGSGPVWPFALAMTSRQSL
jgi:ATP-dependent DNA helicase RecQ